MFRFSRLASNLAIALLINLGTIDAFAQCNVILCTSHDINLPVHIVNGSTGPALTVLGGRVGIGTTSPAAGLEVALTGADSAILLPRDTTANRPSGLAGMIRYNTDLQAVEVFNSTNWIALGSGGVTPTPTPSPTPTPNPGGSQWSDVSSGIAYSSGSVGIGTTSPNAELDIRSSSPHLMLSNSATGVGSNMDMGISFKDNSNIDVGFIGYSTSRDLRIYNPQYGVSLGGNGNPHQVYIAQSGNVGIGTSSPESKLDVRGLLSVGTPNTEITNNHAVIVGKSNTTPHLILEFAGSNTAGFAVSQSSAVLATEVGPLIFKTGIEYNGNYAATGSERMRITEAGNVGIGVNNPNMSLVVGGSGIRSFGTVEESPVGADRVDIGVRNNTPRIVLEDDAVSGTWQLVNDTNQLRVMSLNSPSSLAVYMSGNMGIGTFAPSHKLHLVGDLRVQGSTTDCVLGNGSGGTSCSSDIELKSNLAPIHNALEKIASLEGVDFDWNSKSNKPGRHDIGVIAQQVEKVFPSSVSTNKATGYKMVDYASLVAPLIESTKSLKSMNEEQAERIQKLEFENQDLKARLERIEKILVR